MTEQTKHHQKQPLSLGIVGARGYVGKELLALVDQHPLLKISWISSRQLEGASSNDLYDTQDPIVIENLAPKQVAQRNTDVIVLALPNGLATDYVEAIEAAQSGQCIIDLSADYRFTPGWTYSLPELAKTELAGTRLISNPGCYATAMQLALAPILDLLDGRPACFGVSGYSGAGTKPSPNNNPEVLKDNLVGYGLTEHLHEKEVSHHLEKPVTFSPHVAEFFRGINMTVQVAFKQPQTAEQLLEKYQAFYAEAQMVHCQQSIPTIRQIVDTPYCLIGGFSVSQDGHRATIVACLDNLLKGAASQALQNINLALGFEATQGLTLNPMISPVQENC